MRRRAWIEHATAGSSGRFLAALLLAAIGIRATGLLTFAIYGAATTVATGKPGAGEVAANCLAFAFLSVFYLPLTALQVAVGGAAIHLLVAPVGLRGWAAYALAGLLSGSALSVLVGPEFFIVHPQPPDGRWEWTFILQTGGLPCVGGALTFWAVLRPDRPAPDERRPD